MANLREQQAQQRRAQFIQTALELFALQGYDNTTTKDLARKAGVTEGLLYHYFSSKEELLVAVVETYSFLPRLESLQNLPATGDVTQVLNEISRQFVALLQENHQLVSILLREAQINPSVAHWFNQFTEQGIKLLTNYLTAQIEAGHLRLHDSETVARSLIYSIVMSQITGKVSATFIQNLITELVKKD